MIDFFLHDENRNPYKPLEPLPPAPTSAGDAATMGFLKGGVEVAGALEIAGGGIAGLLGMDESRDRFFKAYEDYIMPARKELTPDPASVSLVGSILHGASSMILPLMTGKAAVPLLIGSATMNTGAELVDQGVDPGTAVGAGIGAGVVNAAMIKIPAAGKNLWQTLGLIAANPAIGAVQREVMKETLEGRGYNEAAKAYDPFDPTALAIDTVMGAFFGGMHLYGEARAKLPIEVEDAIDTAASYQKNIKDTPFENTPKNNRVNLAAKDKAMQDITDGKPVDVSEQIAELHPQESSVVEGKKPAWQMTKEEALQNASVNRYGRVEIAGVEPEYTVGQMQRKAEYTPEQWAEEGYKQIIKKAYAEGKPVPEEVWKENPGLKEEAVKAAIPFKQSETPEQAQARETAIDAINELHDTVDEVARLNGMEPEIMDMEQGSPEWLELRMGKRMASESSAVLGISPFMKPADLWAYKTGRKQFVETPAMTHGKINEEPARNFINQQYNQDFKPAVMMKGEMGASLDGVSPDGKTILEIKVPYKGKDSELWKEAQGKTIPEHYRVQLQHQLMVSGADEAWFVVYDRKTRHHLKIVEKADPAMQQKIVEAWDKFWPHIAEDRAPFKGAERRHDEVMRKKVENMTPEEKDYALHHDELTGLKNQRAWDELPKEGKVTAITDAEGVKWANDEYGYHNGDVLLKAYADSMKEAGIEAYRAGKGADELYTAWDSQDAASTKLAEAQKIFSEKILEFDTPDGKIYVKGGRFDYGYGQDIKAATETLHTAKGTRFAARGDKPSGLYEVTPEGVKIDKSAESRGTGEGSSAPELKPYITLKRPVKSNTVVDWIEKQGKINYNKEHFKGELDILTESDPRFKSLLSKKDKGLTLDELAIRARDEGFIKEADPQLLLDAIEKRKMRIADEEDFLVKEMEYNKPILNDPIEKMVESKLKEEDIPVYKKDESGNGVYESARERIDDAKEEYYKTKSQEDIYTRIGNCVRGGG